MQSGVVITKLLISFPFGLFLKDTKTLVVGYSSRQSSLGSGRITKYLSCLNSLHKFSLGMLFFQRTLQVLLFWSSFLWVVASVGACFGAWASLHAHHASSKCPK